MNHSRRPFLLLGVLLFAGSTATVALAIPSQAAAVKPPTVIMRAPCKPDDTGHIGIPSVAGLTYEAASPGWRVVNPPYVGVAPRVVRFRAVDDSGTVVGGPWNVKMTFGNGSTSSCTFTKTSAPKISGTVAVGRTVHATHGAWSAKSYGQKVPLRYSYQWLRNNKSIPKATKSSFRLTKADKGKRLSVRVNVTGDPYPWAGHRRSTAHTVR